MNEELKFLGKFKKKKIGGSGGLGQGGGRVSGRAGVGWGGTGLGGQGRCE